MQAYYLMKIQIILKQFDFTIFEGVTALFHKEYFIKQFVWATPLKF